MRYKVIGTVSCEKLWYPFVYHWSLYMGWRFHLVMSIHVEAKERVSQ